MNLFPTQYSTLSSAALNDHLQQAYGLTGTLCRLLIRNVSDTYVLENSTVQYIFKIYRDNHRKHQEILAEVALLEALKAGGACVSYPIRDKAGNALQQFNAAEGTRYGVLFSYAKGEVVRDLSTAQLQVVGKEMAAIHNITASLQLPWERREYTIATTLTGPLQTIAPAFKNLPEEYQWLSDTVQKVIQTLNALPAEEFSYGYCHYDFLPKNFHFDTDNQVTFFDFDFAGKGWLVNDLMTIQVHFFLHQLMKATTEEQAQAGFSTFLQAYREVRTVSETELQAIPYLGFAFWLFYLEFAYLHFDDWSNFFFNDRFLKDRTGLIKKYTEQYCRW